MSKIYIVYWSGTGNTEKMANFVADGVKLKGKTPEVLDVSLLKASNLKEEDKFALGCPSMGAEQLAESDSETAIPHNTFPLLSFSLIIVAYFSTYIILSSVNLFFHFK
ncbi:flavodoxin domain-containing protein [Clostridioides sp. ZZV15-6383]|uniref:flavodoxin domain-containing protein n=1 Tax=unclassified Clostridioides TaxID=2635829 RepID=UPI001D12AA57